jgi:hypothetical protein
MRSHSMTEPSRLQLHLLLVWTEKRRHVASTCTDMRWKRGLETGNRVKAREANDLTAKVCKPGQCPPKALVEDSHSPEFGKSDDFDSQILGSGLKAWTASSGRALVPRNCPIGVFIAAGDPPAARICLWPVPLKTSSPKLNQTRKSFHTSSSLTAGISCSIH